MRFSEHLWQQITPLYEAILDHDFVKELITGALSTERFAYYIQQDALYLADFSRALAQLAARSESPEDSLQFTLFAQNAILVERALHESFFVSFDITPETTKMPACFAYTNYLLASTSLQSVAVGAAAVLPCFWIYREVGKHIYKLATPNNPYQAWIDTYAGDAFDAAVNQMLAIVDRLVVEASPSLRTNMDDAFHQSSRLEWYFWDDAYKQTRWFAPS